jgi:hypothetical protein
MASQAELSHLAINQILLATDSSPGAHHAMQCAVSLAKREGMVAPENLTESNKGESHVQSLGTGLPLCGSSS